MDKGTKRKISESCSLNLSFLSTFAKESMKGLFKRKDDFMADILKWKEADIVKAIKHDMRRLPDGYTRKKSSIHPEDTHKNYSLISRGNTCKEINEYRLEQGKKIHRYNREGLVEAVGFVVQRPGDLPESQVEAFYRECHNFFVEKFLGGHEEFVFVSEVHVDEDFVPTNQPNLSRSKLSKEHLHIMAIPAVSTSKHTGFDFKLSAHDLTSKTMLRSLHPELQSRLDAKEICATVFHKGNGGGKNIGFSVEQLKELTETYGIHLDHTVTAKEFAEIVSKDTTVSQHVALLNSNLIENKTVLRELKNSLSERVLELERSKTVTQNNVWGNTQTWGNSNPWDSKSKEVEKLW